jgi:hypothetical protein
MNLLVESKQVRAHIINASAAGSASAYTHKPDELDFKGLQVYGHAVITAIKDLSSPTRETRVDCL